MLPYSVVPVIGIWLLAGWSYSFDNYHGSWWTQKVTVYPVECHGTVVFDKICCGSLGIPLNPTTFTVSVDRQQVFESTAGIMTPLSNCQVQDYLNWECTTYWDASETKEVASSEAAAYDRTIMSAGSYQIVHSPGLTPVSTALEAVSIGKSVYVRASDWYLGQTYGWWDQHKGIWAEGPNSVQRSSGDWICKASATP